MGESACLGGNSLKDIIDEAVHDAHGLGADASVGVDLFEHLVDVDAEALLSLGSPLGLLIGWCRLFDSLLGAFSWCHVGGFRLCVSVNGRH